MKARAALVVALVLVAACGRDAPGEPVELQVPRGASFAVVVDTLHARGVVGWPRLFRLYARIHGDDERIKAGRYALARGQGWSRLLDVLTEGNVVTEPLTIPEGFRLPQIAERVAALTELPGDSVLRALDAPAADTVYGVPGPGLEGYLFPDTYHFAAGVPLERVIRAMTTRYLQVWNPERRASLSALGLSEREVVTLASIVQAEARLPEEMPRIASVYLNRLEQGWLLQADPTVLYALGGPRERLLFAAIDSVADDPYNTYTQAGLPPGPIGVPGEAAVDAVLESAGEPFFYFVAWPDGSHRFSRTLAEHNRAVAQARRERARARDEGSTSGRR